jgi:Tfp pilus assembly protein PilX|tara:strand:- start:993 stop:1565 length:573 start_codon:yes stop_codon:yes gene_type:complete
MRGTLSGFESSAGIALVACLIILTALALIAINGNDRSIVNFRLVDNQQRRAHSFMLAEVGIERGISLLSKQAPSFDPTVRKLDRVERSEGSYEVYLAYKNSDLLCTEGNNKVINEESDTGRTQRHHYEIVSGADAGRSAWSAHARGVSLCEYPETAGSIKVGYWRPLSKAEYNLLLQGTSTKNAEDDISK